MIQIICPQTGTPDFRAHHIQLAYDIYNRAPSSFVGFIRKEEWQHKVGENSKRGSLWYALLDETVVGVGMAGGRQRPEHLWRHSVVAVDRQYQRQGIGTALYCAQIYQAILEGKRQLEVTILQQNDGIRGLIQHLGYSRWGELPERTKAFNTMEIWGREIYYPLPEETKGFSFQVVDSPALLQVFNTRMGEYRAEWPERLTVDREDLLTHPQITILSGE